MIKKKCAYFSDRRKCKNISCFLALMTIMTQGIFPSLSIETINQESLPCVESSLEPVYVSSPSHKEVDHLQDEIYLLVADWNTPSTSKESEQYSTNDCISATVSIIDFEPSRRILTSAYPPPPSEFLRSTKKSKTR